jgi:pyridoxamine 5'-phosphate oxidase
MADMQDPFELFGEWYQKAWDKEPADAHAMALATADADGFPNVRIVLLKGFDADGFVFYTNMESQKGQELAVNARAALCWHWKSLKKQIRVRGPISVVSDEEADAYYATRPRDSQIGAWASDQSRSLGSRFELEKRIARFGAKYALGKVPRPAHWSGYRLTAERIEFWEDRPFRLHDRLVYTRDNEAWRTEKLFP